MINNGTKPVCVTHTKIKFALSRVSYNNHCYILHQIADYIPMQNIVDKVGFRKDKPSIDQIFSVKQILHNVCEYDVYEYKIFTECPKNQAIKLVSPHKKPNNKAIPNQVRFNKIRLASLCCIFMLS